MVERKISIINPTGLAVRPAGVLTREAMNFKSSVTFKKGTLSGNAKSVLSVLGAQIRMGDEITLICDGPDEEEAMEAVSAAIESGLGEK